MSEFNAGTEAKTAPTSLGALLRCAAYPLALGMVATILCYLAAGRSLGFFLGAVAMACLIVPPLVAGARDRLAAVIIAGSVVDAIGIVWLFAVIGHGVTLAQWLACYSVLAAFAFGVAGLTWVLRRAVAAIASSAIAVVIAVGWLSWPIWTSPWVTAEVAAWLAPAHPLLAMNRVLLDLGVWTQQPWMYRHTTLGQDVAFALPRTIWPCIVMHAVMAMGLLVRAAEPTRAARAAQGVDPG